MNDSSLRYLDDDALFTLFATHRRNFKFVSDIIGKFGPNDVPIYRINERDSIIKQLDAIEAECQRRGIDSPSLTTQAATPNDKPGPTTTGGSTKNFYFNSPSERTIITDTYIENASEKDDDT